jgi:hypothetical protein
LAFVQHVNRSLREKGCGVVLVPNGVLFRSGNDHEIKKHLCILLAALFVILSNHYDDAAQKWAFGIVGTVLWMALRR